MFRLVFAISWMLITTLPSLAQEADDPDQALPIYNNAISLNTPNYVVCAKFPGFSVGLEYQRLIGAKNRFGASLSLTKLIWAGTPETGEGFSKGVRANIKADYVETGIHYYPFGTRGTTSIELGALILVGQIRRTNKWSNQHSESDQGIFIAPQGHFGMSLHSGGHFIFTFYGNFGPILAADNFTKGNYGIIGGKFGWRFGKRPH